MIMKKKQNHTWNNWFNIKTKEFIAKEHHKINKDEINSKNNLNDNELKKSNLDINIQKKQQKIW